MKVEVDGQQYDVPDDATTEEIDQISRPQAPQGFFARAMNREVPASLQNQPPGTFDLLKRGMDWMGQKQGENLAKVAKEHGQDAAEHARLFSGMLGMGALGGAGVVGNRNLLPEKPPPGPAPTPVASPSAPAQTGGSVLREALGWATHPKLKAAQKVLDVLLKREGPPPAPPTSYPSVEAPPSSWSSTYGPQPTPPSLPSTPGAEPIAPPQISDVSLSRLPPNPDTLNPARLARVQQAIAEGKDLGPIRLFRDVNDPDLARIMVDDGQHRIAAARASGQNTIKAELVGEAPAGGWPVSKEQSVTGPQAPPATTASTAIGEADLAPSTLQRMQAVMGKPPPAGNAYEGLARANKVSELVKAIDANAGAHLGADMRDPRAAAALAEMPAQWWEGMAKAARINKPSQQTINQAIEFFKTRSAQGALPKAG